MTQVPELPDRIQWHEGMLLSPQHFQQESARTDALVAWHGLAANPYAWGIKVLQLDEALLSNGLLRILRLEAVMPDGTAVMYQAGDIEGGDLQLDLLAHAQEAEQGHVMVYLTLGRSRSMRDAGNPSRFIGVSQAAVEDEVSNALPVDVPRMRPNLMLSAGAVPPAVVMHQRLLTIFKVNEIFKRGPYLHALLEVPQDSEIRSRAMALAIQMRSKAAFLAKQNAVPSSRLEDRVQLLEQRSRLDALVLTLPLLEAVLRSPVLTPYALYLSLCVQLGSLSMLRPGALPLLPPAWNHADPLNSLVPIFESLEESLAEVSQDWRTQVFRLESGMFELDLPIEWSGSRLVIGLRGLPERELQAWMNGAVIGSRNLWSSLSDRRILGAPRLAIDEAPELGLRGSTGYVLFAVDALPEFVVAEQALVVCNANEMRSAQRPQELVLFVKG